MTQISKHCLDCEERLTGPFCHRCGQKVSNVHRSCFLLVKEIAAEQISLDSKLTKALKILISKPGLLTTEFLAGRRTRYYTPIRLYLLVSVVFFFLRIYTLPPTNEGLMRRMDERQNKIIDAMSMFLSTETTEEIKSKNNNNVVVVKFHQLRDKKRLTPFIIKNFNRMPTVMFFLLPVFALMLRLLYLRHGKTFCYFEHLIFSLHFHAFAFLVCSFFIILPSLPLQFWIASLIVAAYLYMAMHRVYGQSHPKTLVKWGLLGFGYSICFTGSFGGMILTSLIRATS